MNKRYYEHTLPIIRGSLSNTYIYTLFLTPFCGKGFSREIRVRIPKSIIKRCKICFDSDYYILQTKN